MGGKAFPNSVPIENDKADGLSQDVINLLPVGVDYGSIGSSAHYKPEYNDLDFAVVVNDEEWSFFKETLEYKNIPYKPITSHCISIGMPNTSDTVYQVDVMRSKNILFTKDAYFSDIHSKYKGAHRNILLNSIINVLTTEIHDNIRMKKYMDLYHGMSFLVQTKSEKSQRYRTIKSVCLCDPNFVQYTQYTQSVQTVISNITWTDLRSFENLFYFVVEHVSHSKTILIEAKKIINTTDLVMPEELDWLNA